eukprot:CAMPEP_0203950766 /NCGR_PEP_ID=MMETSP0359-20131031/84803_1 /ASSEMBLY_ACC=CAM_ASM_000338 /TAXON_ID=268821 /ORGANISM="Scrippsiella Hangoei, Strain SHTV-5" /LENGTH=437 /DNA_ID=CAMNT_0050883083 /DNA_START=67 /DNA_END=1380 /DNA_ORIENTATION=+
MAIKKRKPHESGALEIAPKAEAASLTLVAGKKRGSKATLREAKRQRLDDGVGASAPTPAAAALPEAAAGAGGKRRVSKRGQQKKGKVAAEVQFAAEVKTAPPLELRKTRKKNGKAAAGADGSALARPPATAGNAAAAAGKAKLPLSGKVNTFVPTDGPFTYNPDPDDHCETDVRAYRHIKPLLQQIEKAIYGKNAGELKLWDPYYCNGGTVKNLANLGFPKVHNRNEDFYAVLASGKLPPHDVLITSPPYSEDHIEKCMRHAAFSGKPWCILLPNWVNRKDYFQELLKTAPSLIGVAPQYLGPIGKSYHYWFPEGAEQRPDHVGTDGKTTPFSSSWHIHLPGSIGGMRLLKNLEAQQRSIGEWVIAKTVKGLKWSARKGEERQFAGQAKAAARASRLTSAGAAAGLQGERVGRGHGAGWKNGRRRFPGASGGDDEDE